MIPIRRNPERSSLRMSDELYPRFAAARVQAAMTDTPVVLLNGPRQSGKTTLARMQSDDARTYRTLDDETTLAAAVADPTGFIRGMEQVTIDEIQRAPALLRAIKKSVDDDRRPGRFLLTGSTNVLSLPQAADSLAGRIAVVEKLGQMPRLLRVLAHHAGQLVNYAGVGGSLDMDAKTAHRYMDVLQQLFLVRSLEPWSTNQLKRLVK